MLKSSHLNSTGQFAQINDADNFLHLTVLSMLVLKSKAVWTSRQTKVSEEHTTSVFRAEDGDSMLLPRRTTSKSSQL
jgi:hypothetical protein